MTDFDTLQNAIALTAQQRQAEAVACEHFLSALYLALRHANGAGQPLNNVRMEPATELVRLRPLPLGSWHAVWFRLGLCEVLLRVRREGGDFVGEYAEGQSFRLAGVSEQAMQGLARQLLRALAGLYQSDYQTRQMTN